MKKSLIIIIIISIFIIGCGMYILCTNAINLRPKNKLNNVDSEQIAENKTIDKVKILIKDGTLTKTGATIIISDENEQPYTYGKWYRIDKKENGVWKELIPIIDNYSWIEIAYKIGEDGKLEQKIDWTKLYGELKNGEYRLVKDINYNQYFWVEFNI